MVVEPEQGAPRHVLILPLGDLLGPRGMVSKQLCPRDILAVLTSVAAVIISALAILAAVISLITVVIICRG